MNRLRFWLLGVALAAAAAPLNEPALTPLQDSVYWPEPNSATALRVNPPTFRWPGEGAREFELELARSPDFQNPVKVTAAAEFYRPIHSIDPGQWHWRVRAAGGQWKPASFQIPADLPKWDLPEWDE